LFAFAGVERTLRRALYSSFYGARAQAAYASLDTDYNRHDRVALMSSRLGRPISAQRAVLADIVPECQIIFPIPPTGLNDRMIRVIVPTSEAERYGVYIDGVARASPHAFTRRA
jgi:hypothetical protein